MSVELENEEDAGFDPGLGSAAARTAELREEEQKQQSDSEDRAVISSDEEGEITGDTAMMKDDLLQHKTEDRDDSDEEGEVSMHSSEEHEEGSSLSDGYSDLSDELLSSLDLWEKSQSCKEDGNELFKKGDYSGAMDRYGEGIEQLVELRTRLKEDGEQSDSHEDSSDIDGSAAAETAIITSDTERKAEEDCSSHQQSSKKTAAAADITGDKDENDEKESGMMIEEEKKTDDDDQGSGLTHWTSEMQDTLALLYCNHAACALKHEEWDLVVEDCTECLFLKPKFEKAFWRRAQAYEFKEEWMNASEDYKRIEEFTETHDWKMMAQKRRLRISDKTEAEMQQKKDEVIGQLKTFADWGLGKLGLSTKNFEMKQDPQTGSYNFQFNPNPSS